MSDRTETPTQKPVWKRCWCLQWGRCLTECPTADLPRPVPFITDENWRKSYADVVARPGGPRP